MRFRLFGRRLNFFNRHAHVQLPIGLDDKELLDAGSYGNYCIPADQQILRRPVLVPSSRVDYCRFACGSRQNSQSVTSCPGPQQIVDDAGSLEIPAAPSELGQQPAIFKAVSAIRRKGTTAVTASRAIASLGMPKTTQLDSFWAMVSAPQLRISSKP